MRAGNANVAIVVDDVVSVEPWTPRYIRVYGTATLVERHGQFGEGLYLQITPAISWSFNLDARPFTDDSIEPPSAHRTVHAASPAT